VSSPAHGEPLPARPSSGTAKDCPRVRVEPDCDAAARAACAEWVESMSGGTRKEPRRALLAGGSTPERLYRLLADAQFVPRDLWRSIECFFGDERCVPPDHPDSNFGMVRRSLLTPLGDEAPTIHRIRGEDPSPESAADQYEALIRARFGVARGAVPAFDLALLGVGPDGHTASLFPGAEPRVRSKRLISPALRPADGSPRVTATYRLLNASRRVLFFVCGAEKEEAVARSLVGLNGAGVGSGGGPFEPTPAALIQPESHDVVWVLDRVAAGRLHP